MTLPSTSRFFASLTAFFFLSCGAGCSRNTASPCSGQEITRYLVTPTAASFAALDACTADTALLQTILSKSRAAGPAGEARVRLTDSSGMTYGLGYRTPASIRQDTTYPLIIYLHGGTGTERSDKGDSAFLMLEALADTFNLFIASPSANRYAPWWSPAGLSRMLQTLRYMALHYPIDPDKVFLAGVSDGATGCYAAANTICGPFAGFFAISGFGGMLPGLGMQLVPANLLHRPIYNVNAGLDRIYPLDYVKQFIADLSTQGVPVITNYYPEEKHGFDYRDREMGALAGYIRTWSRPRTTSIAWTFIPGFPNCPENLADWTMSAGESFIRTYWRHDTLMVRSQGLSSFVIALPNRRMSDKILCCFPAQNNRVKYFSAEKKWWPLALKSLVTACYLKNEHASFYTITMK